MTSLSLYHVFFQTLPLPFFSLLFFRTWNFQVPDIAWIVQRKNKCRLLSQMKTHPNRIGNLWNHMNHLQHIRWFIWCLSVWSKSLELANLFVESKMSCDFSERNYKLNVCVCGVWFRRTHNEFPRRVEYTWMNTYEKRQFVDARVKCAIFSDTWRKTDER